MSSQAGYIEYTCSGGETWDSIAMMAYKEERMASLIMDANRDMLSTIMFEGGEVIRLPIITKSQVVNDETLPPWRRGDDSE